MEAEYERTRDRARAFLSAIDELSTFRDQVASSSEDGKESLENALEVSERGVVNQRHRWQRGRSRTACSCKEAHAALAAPSQVVGRSWQLRHRTGGT